MAEDKKQQEEDCNADLPQILAEYGGEVPLTAYMQLMALYSLIFGLFLLVARRRGSRLPDVPHWGDVVMVGIATHKLSRLVTKAGITSPLRAPFTKQGESSSVPGEQKDKPRGARLQKAVGELLTCPFCVGAWIASLLTYGLVVWPRHTRVIGSIWSSVTVADFLHMFYCAAEKTTK